MEQRMKYVCVALLLVVSAMPASAKTYGNARFGFFVDVPKQFTQMDPPPENGDGAVYHTADKSAELRASGGWIMGDNFAADVTESKGYDTSDGWKISYESTVSADAASWSGSKDGRIFYERMITSCKGQAKADYRLEYPQADQAKYDSVVKALNASFRAGKGSCEGN